MSLRTVDLFCGCGGFTQGLTDVGFDVVCGVDINQAILHTYSRNFAHSAICHDLSNWEEAVDIIKQRFPNLDCIAGSPPCIEFSRAGNQVEGDIASLTICFAKIVTSIKPPLFIMENVPDVVMSESFAKARDVFTSSGYNFSTIIKDAKHCGVPQARRRAFIIGIAGDGVDSLKSMVKDCALNEAKISIKSYFRMRGVTCPEYFFFPARNKFQASVISTEDQYPTMRSCNGICMNKKPSNVDSYIKRPNDAAHISRAHTMSIEQASCISSFPTSFIWPDDRRQVGIMLGNCVPPGVASYIGTMVMKHLDSSVPPRGGEGIWVNPRQKRTLKMVSHIHAFEEKAVEADCDTIHVRKKRIIPSDAHANEREAFRPSSTNAPMELYYTVGSDANLDNIAKEVMGFTMKPGWTFYIKERICQQSRIDDMFVIVPDQPVPYRGKSMLIKNGLLP